MLGAPQSCIDEASDDFAAGDGVGAEPDGRDVPGFGDVVMVPVEAASGGTERLRERVQLGE